MAVKSAACAFLATLLCFAGISSSRAMEERLDVDPILRGIWKVHATSEDRGKTITKQNGWVLARVYATKVKLANGTVIGVDKILITLDSDGDPANGMRLSNGTIWMVTKKKGNAFFLIQVLQSDGTETMRFLITVVE